MTEDRLEYARMAAAIAYIGLADQWIGTQHEGSPVHVHHDDMLQDVADNHARHLTDAFLAAIAERGDPEDIVALLAKVGWEGFRASPCDYPEHVGCGWRSGEIVLDSPDKETP